MITVPALVDSVKDYADWAMTRLTYFSIVCDLPSPGLLEPAARDKTLNPRARIPFLLLGNAGIVYKPLGRARRFQSLDQVRAVFKAIDDQEGLFIDVDDFWLPNAAFPSRGRGRAPDRGRVYRVSLEVLRLAWAFGLQQLSKADFEARAAARRGEVRFSPDETAAFGEWSQGIVAEARRLYHAKPEGRLRWTEIKAGPPDGGESGGGVESDPGGEPGGSGGAGTGGGGRS